MLEQTAVEFNIEDTQSEEGQHLLKIIDNLLHRWGEADWTRAIAHLHRFNQTMKSELGRLRHRFDVKRS